MRALRTGWMIVLSVLLCKSAATAVDNLRGVVTAVRGKAVELSIGSADGVKRGMVFRTATPTGQTARFEVTTVNIHRSTARIVQNADLTLLGERVVLEERASIPETQPAASAASASSGSVSSADLPPKVAPPVLQPPPLPESKGPVVTIKATIITIEEGKVVISAGRMDGLETGMSVVIRRNQQRLALLYIERVEAQQSVGRLFNIETGASLHAGDEITLVYQPSAEGSGVSVPPLGPPEARLPRLPQFTVPRTEKSYDLLGALAGEGLINKYPARVFHEDAPFRSRAEGSIVLTRAQIAVLINEAIENLAQQLNDKVAHSSIVALNQLVREYEKEMRALRPDFESVLSQLDKAQRERSPLGFGGFFRYGNISTRGDGIRPRTELTQPGPGSLDLRFNLFANLNRKTTFEGQFNTSSEVSGRSGTIRRAILTVDDAIKLPFRWRLQMEAGRGDFWYGVGRFSTLLLSDAGGPYDYVKVRVSMGDFQYEGFTSVIGEDPRKNLYAHRLEARVNNNVRLGFAEVALAPEQRLSGSYLFATFLPVMLYPVVDRLVSGKGITETNSIAVLYVESNVADGFQLYSEFLIDDLVLRARESAPHRTGFLMGAQAFLAKKPLKFNGHLEFVHLQPGVYQSSRVVENYFRGDRPIGYILATQDPRALGINSIHLNMNYMPIKKLTLGISLEVSDLGADSPVLSRQHILRLRALYDVAPNFVIGIRTTRTSTINDNFIPNTFSRQDRVEFYLLRTF